MTFSESSISELTMLEAAQAGAGAVAFTLCIDGVTRRYVAPYYAHAEDALRGFDFPVEVRRILRVHGAAGREMVRTLFAVMDGEQVEFPRRLTIRQEAEELQAV